MKTYLICFIISIMLFIASSKIKKSQVKRMTIFAALAIPILLAAFRSDTVGTDVQVYLKPLYEAAVSSDSFLDYYQAKWYSIWRYVYVKEYEIAFSIIVYTVSVATKSLLCVQGVIMSLVILPVYFGLKKMSPKITVWLGMAVFYFMFYNASLNLMRQMIACALCFFAVASLVHGEKKRYYISLSIAVLFHYSAIIGLLFLFLNRYITKQAEKVEHKKKTVRVRLGSYVLFGNKLNNILFLVASFGMMVAMPLLVEVLRYLIGNNWYLHGSYTIMLNQIILRLPLLIPVILNRKRFAPNDKFYFFALASIYAEMVLSQLAGLSEQTVRIVYYFSIVNVATIPYICRALPAVRKGIYQCYYLIYIVIYWVYYYVINNSANTIPYVLGL